jgi:hypothetical protein
VISQKDTAKLSHLLAMLNSNLLEFAKAELDDLPACEAALQGADYLIHCASPYAFSVKDPLKDLVEPAENGAVNFLKAAKVFLLLNRFCASITLILWDRLLAP